MVAFTKPRLRKKIDSERPRGEGDQIKFVDLRFDKGFGKENKASTNCTFLE